MLKQCSSWHQKCTSQKKQNENCCAVAMTTVDAGPVLIKTEIPNFYLNQRQSTPADLIARVKTVWEPCLFQAGPSFPL